MLSKMRPLMTAQDEEQPMTRGIYPEARLRLIPAGSNDPPIEPRAAILHVAVSMAASLYEFFRYRSGGIESHFYVNWRGKVEQYRSIFREADANYKANAFAISIETAGWGTGWWNPLQKRAIKRLLLWLNEETNGAIPLTVCDSPTGSGIGYHTMWGSPSPWTPVAKSCPGPNRIKQFIRWLTPWLESNPAQQQEEEDMATAQEIADAILSTKVYTDPETGEEWSMRRALRRAAKSLDEFEKHRKAMEDEAGK
jgi:hypothetical protein